MVRIDIRKGTRIDIPIWDIVKEKLASEGAPNKLYDPDLDGILGTVSVEELILPNGVKFYFGTDKKYSLRYDPAKGEFVIRNEEEGVDVVVIS